MKRGDWVLFVTPVFATAVLYGLITQERFPVLQAIWATFSPFGAQVAFWYWLRRFPLERAYGLPLLGAVIFSLGLGLITYVVGLFVQRGADMAYLAGGLAFIVLLFTWRWSFRNYEKD